MKKPKLYKVLGTGQASCNGGNAKWVKGKWMPKIGGELEPCRNGYHLCRKKDLLEWLNEEIWEAEYRGEVVEANDKIVVREARIVRRVKTWDEKTARLFACDCAEAALKLIEKPDARSVEAIRVARLFANGKATKEELAAAGDAAWAAAGDAAWAAAWDAAGAPAWDAAGAAAWAPARAAARAAALAAARAAALAAAGAPALAAARDAARAAAWAPAWDAARAAARAAAWAAAKKRQTQLLCKRLGI